MALAALAKKVWSARRLLVLLVTPLALLPVVFALPSKEGRCLFVILLMAVYWCTEALPLSVTALLPIILFPFLGILPSSKVCPQYFLDTNFLFLSGLIMASAIEEWNLHRRIALKVLMLVGVQPAWLILGMMVTTSFLSMWLSNTASTAMMLPIASAILKSLFGQKEARKDLSSETEENAAAAQTNGLHTVPTEMQFLASPEDKDCPEEVEAPFSKKEEEYRRNIWKGFLISIPYSASIGGTATLTGTPPNLILLGQLKRGWRKKKSDIRADAEERARAVIREEFQNLGPIKFLSDAVTGVAIVTILFFFPSQRPSLKWWFDFKAPNTETKPLLTWKKAQDTVPWNIILLLGGGFAMAKGCEINQRTPLSLMTLQCGSGMSLTLRMFSPCLPWSGSICLSVCLSISAYRIPLFRVFVFRAAFFFLCLLTCPLVCVYCPFSLGNLYPCVFASLAVSTSVFHAALLPTVSISCCGVSIILYVSSAPSWAQAIRLRVHPLYLMIPGTVGCSYAFMLPVSTPPNSIAFASGHLLVKDMVRAGFLMNLMGVLLLNLAINTWAQAIFQLGTFPDWALNHSGSVTTLSPTLANNTFRTL
ncbi:PREDICTED: solute carrier family 13 member 3 [Hipposideros armiger]|uniref:Solute carrier family 13 member 3 n=1 Tax=Hipposideros armiger TaxID=186990 RepID=A0A8B7QVZ7_HIPAR|nr:PREDICTED: solute carrier family 13 member 3 [Hipposideros armiger]